MFESVIVSVSMSVCVAVCLGIFEYVCFPYVHLWWWFNEESAGAIRCSSHRLLMLQCVEGEALFTPSTKSQSAICSGSLQRMCKPESRIFLKCVSSVQLALLLHEQETCR